MKCAVIIPVGPGHDELSREAGASVERAFRENPGPFSEVATFRLNDTKGERGRSACRNLGVERAATDGFEWVFFLDADDVMAPGCFAAVKDHVADRDAIFGLIAETAGDVEAATLRPDQVRATDSFGDILRNDPTLTLQMGHFVRTEIVRGIRFDEAMDCGEDFKYYLDLWFRHRCRKIEEVLFVNRRGRHSTGPRSANGRQWSEAVRGVFGDFCRSIKMVARFNYDGVRVGFAVDDPFDLIHRHFLSGMYFEEAELEYLRSIVPLNAVIIEVGANVGNHAVYYGLHMAPKRVVVVEPNPAAIALLKRNVEINGLTTIDLSRLGVGVGDGFGRYELVLDTPGNLGAARVVPSETGDIQVVPLDSLVDEPVDFVKIDVEWMEIQALRGAEALFRAGRPILAIEIMNANIPAFMDWLAEHAYRIVREFPYVNARNYVVVPVESPIKSDGAIQGEDTPTHAC